MGSKIVPCPKCDCPLKRVWLHWDTIIKGRSQAWESIGWYCIHCGWFKEDMTKRDQAIDELTERKQDER